MEKICPVCNKEFTSKSNQVYCSSSCSTKYKNRVNYQKRKIPVSQNLGSIQPVTNKSNDIILNTVTTGLANSFTGGVGNIVNTGISSLASTNKDATYENLFSIIGGGYSAYKYYKNNKKRKNVLQESVVVFGGGTIVCKILYKAGEKLFESFKDKYQQNKIEQQEIQQQQLQNNLSGTTNNNIYKASELKYIRQPSLTFSGIWADFIGEEVNYNFSMMIYGEAGSGKSYFATMLASYLEDRFKNVLLVLAEEGFSNSVTERIEKYHLQDTDIIQTRDANEVIETIKAKNSKIVIIDSLNGLSLNYTEHVKLIRQLKALNLFGLVFIMQVNKDGHFTGRNEILHEVDVEISVQNGIATTGGTEFKNRFSQLPMSINIFETPNTNIVQLNRAVNY